MLISHREFVWLLAAILLLAGCGSAQKDPGPFVPQSPLWPVTPRAYALATLTPPWPTATPSGYEMPSPVFHSPLPTPTPLPPLGLPTVTPPFELSWRPSPTPLPVPAEWVRHALATDQGIPVEQIFMVQHAVVRHPTTGKRAWIGNFHAVNESHGFWVMADETGQLQPVPEFTSRAQAWAAEQANISPDQVMIIDQLSVLLPFSEQYFWYARVMALDGRSAIESVAFDLVGRPADEAALRAAEEAAQREQCGVMDPYSCQQAVEARDEVLPFAFTLSPGADAVTARIEAAGYSWRPLDRYQIASRLPARLALALAHERPVISAMHAPMAGWVEPLNTALRLAFSEEGGAFTLHLRTAENYGCIGHQVSATVEQADTRIDVQIAGIEQPKGACPAMEGPATAELELGALQGAYELRLAHAQMLDVYDVAVTADEIVVRPQAQAFTWFNYLTWRRLPAGVVWFVAADSYGAGQSQAESDEWKERFYAQVEAAGAQRFYPEEGIYTHPGFIPPWPNWWRGEGDRRQAPTNDPSSFGGLYEFYRPDIRYYRYDGDWDRLAGLVGLFGQDGKIVVRGHSATGEHAW